MSEFDEEEKTLLDMIMGFCEEPVGAFNFRVNGESVGRRSAGNIDVTVTEEGLRVQVGSAARGEVVHVPVIISKTGHKEVVRNEFLIEDGAEVTIIAGCGIYNCGGLDSAHNGVHRLRVGKGAKVVYMEKHYGMGAGRGGKVLNPATEIVAEENSEVRMELVQIKGVDSALRRTTCELGPGAKLVVQERLMTYGRQKAESEYKVRLAGENATADIASRSVAQDESRQEFRSVIVGCGKCRGHSECDAIIMDKAQVFAMPSLDARSVEAELIHEAAIGKIAGEQIVKLMTLGLTRAEAESKIINGFLS